MKCCMCGKEMLGMGHNAAPLIVNRNNRCCNECNEIVIHLRMIEYFSRKEKTEVANKNAAS